MVGSHKATPGQSCFSHYKPTALHLASLNTTDELDVGTEAKYESLQGRGLAPPECNTPGLQEDIYHKYFISVLDSSLLLVIFLLEILNQT